MNCLRIISYVALAGALASARDGGADRDNGPRPGTVEPAAKPSPGENVPLVLKKLEPADNRIVKLPGPPVSKRTPAAPAPAAATLAPAGSHAAGVPALPPTTVPEISRPAAGMDAMPATVPPPTVPPASKAMVLPVWHPMGVPSLPPAPAVWAASPLTAALVMKALAGSTVPAPPRMAGTALPPDFAQESAVFCQKRIGQWSLADARAIFGEPVRKRPAIDDDDVENGHIYAFRDPTSRYRELELDFGSEKGFLRTVFVYPWNLTWQECRRLWGTRVSATAGNKGRVFYSYADRHLDVLVDPGGKVISLGLY